jgi:hypothetical protein
MFTNKTSRRERESQCQQEYIKPFEEADTAPERSKSASTGFMAELEAWLDEFVFEPIEAAISSEDTKELHIAFSEAKQHIKRKVLQSYHNGLKAKQPTNQKNYGRSNFRRN